MYQTKTIARLYISEPLSAGHVLTLPEAQGHYLRNVLRATAGAHIKLFNGQDGEWLAEILRVDRKAVEVECTEVLRPQTSLPPLTLYFAPIKKSPLEFLVEKATELGVTHLCPVLTDYTDTHRIKLERLQATAIEAAEQCERLCLPTIAEPIKLTKLLQTPPAQTILFADERREAPALAQVLSALPDGEPAAFLIGPEGGFSPAEHKALQGHAQVLPCNLGPRILRAETAAVAALSCWQALRGDWIT